MDRARVRPASWLMGGAAMLAAVLCAIGAGVYALTQGDPLLVPAGIAAVAVTAATILWLWLRAPIASLSNVIEVATSAGATLPDRRHIGARISAVTAAVDALLWRLQMADREAEQQSRTLRETTAGVRELVSVLVHTEEVVRAQLSADIHDTVAQSLAHARRLLAETDGAVPDDVCDAVEDAEEQVRGVLSRTAPVALENGDLAGAVRILGDDVQQRYGLRLNITAWPGDDHAMPVSLATVVYRFVQEAMMNVAKHANTDDAYVAVHIEGRDLVASVADDGGGFDPTRVHSSGGRHVGLHLLGERARLLGGSLQICSAPGEQTILRLRLPLPDRRASARSAPNGPEVLRNRADSTSAIA
ncbi:MAG TPA: ATP-binding protein [Mycobacteriales bacterium]|nr:ATP-binding protein [Mycobacteriales bacterium]